jgi:hypothetical protein
MRRIHRQANPAKPRFVAGVLGPTSPHRVDLAGRQRPRLPQRDFRRAGRQLHRGDHRPGRGRRRHPAGRDGVRHAERQGRAVRHRNLLRPRRPPLAGNDFRHHHRCLRPHLVRPDCRGLLEFAEPHPAAVVRPQLRARRQGVAPVRRGTVARLRLLRLGPPERRPAQCLRRLRRDAEMLADEIELGKNRHREHCWRLLRHLAGAHCCHRRAGC